VEGTKKLRAKSMIVSSKRLLVKDEENELTKTHSDNEEDAKKEEEMESEEEQESKVNPPTHLVDFGAAVIHVRLYSGFKYDPTLIDMSLFFDTSDLLSEIKTGDLIAFSGRSPLAAAITGGTDTPYSHVGIAVRMPDPKHPEKKEQLFVMESTHNALNVPDHLTGEVRRGVTIFVYQERLRRIDCMASWHIPLVKPLNEKESQKFIDIAMELHKKGIKYDTKQLITFFFMHNNEDLAELFCSEFAALLLREVGRLPPDTNPSASTPSDVVHSVAYHGKAPGIKVNMTRFQVSNPKSSMYKRNDKK